jgi:hypothetical protein
MVGGAVPVVSEAVNMTDGAVPVADRTDGAVPVADEPERTGGRAVLMACGSVAVVCGLVLVASLPASVVVGTGPTTSPCGW